MYHLLHLLGLPLGQLLKSVECSNSEDHLRTLENAILARIKSLLPVSMHYEADITKLQDGINKIDDPNALIGILHTLESRLQGMKKGNLNGKRAELIFIHLEKISDPEVLLELFEMVSEKLSSVKIDLPYKNKTEDEEISQEKLEEKVEELQDQVIIKQTFEDTRK